MSQQFGTGDEIYLGYSVDGEDQPQGFGESLTDNRGLDEPLDEGYSPPDRWSPGQGFGNTALEAELGETLAQRLAQEEPEPDPYAWRLTDGQQTERRVGGLRAGHLFAYDPGSGDNIVERTSQAEEVAANAWFMGGPDPYWARQVGGRRAGRLVASDTDPGALGEEDLFALDVGIDGAGASAEEAAIHLIEDDAWPDS